MVLMNTCYYGYGGRAHGVTDFEYLYPGPEPEPPALDISGRWRTTVYWDKGRQHADTEIAFTQSGNGVVGVFHLPNEGRMEGTLSGNKFTGTWTRAPYAGTIELTFDPATRTFTGIYGESDDAWNGSKL
jgi:hypothetical protein